MEELARKLGNFGRYQAYLYALIFLPGFMFGVLSLTMSWTCFVPKVRCRLPFEDANSTYEEIMSNSGLRYTYYPSATDKNKDKSLCSYCPGTNNVSSSCTENNAVKCDHGLVFDTSIFQETLATKYGFACEDAYKREFVLASYMLGVLLSNPLIAPIGDRFGRRPAFLSLALAGIVFMNAKFLLEDFGYYALMVTELITGILENGAYLMGYVVFMEVVDGLPKTICGVLYQGTFTLGMLYTVLIAYFVRTWKPTLIYFALPLLLYIPYIWIFPESIRWAVAKQKRGLANKLVKRAARFNRVKIPEAMVEKAILVDVKYDSHASKGNVFSLFTHGWPLARTTGIVAFTWLACSMGYYGLAFNTADLPGDVFVSFTLSSLADLPGLIICVPMMEKLGRRPTFLVLLGGAGLACIGAGFITHAVLKTCLAMIGRMGVAGAFGLVYNYSAEIFPTVVRASGTGMGSASARVGSMAAPLIHNLAHYVSEWLPIVIYGLVALTAALLDLLLPETKGRSYPETMEDAKHYDDAGYWAKKVEVNANRRTGSESSVTMLAMRKADDETDSAIQEQTY